MTTALGALATADSRTRMVRAVRAAENAGVVYASISPRRIA